MTPSVQRTRASGRGETDQQLLLDTVLNNMSQGVLMFDPDTRMVFCNQRYIEMYGLSDAVVQPGCTLRDLLEHRQAAGTFAGDPDPYIAKVLNAVAEGRTANNIVECGDGRVFSIVNKPMPDGGWLATHEDITERQRAEERIAHMARHDALTDLPNRALLRERLEYELKRVKRGECLAVLCLDLDHFKSVNDTLGHPIGDELLKVVAERLRRCTREPDTIARLGGDEFAIIMTGMERPTDAVALAKRIRDSITKPYHLDGHQIVADISIGFIPRFAHFEDFNRREFVSPPFQNIGGALQQARPFFDRCPAPFGKRLARSFDGPFSFGNSRFRSVTDNLVRSARIH